jgi:hypothetical protein
MVYHQAVSSSENLDFGSKGFKLVSYDQQPELVYGVDHHSSIAKIASRKFKQQQYIKEPNFNLNSSHSNELFEKLDFSQLIAINIENLKCYELVHQQFQDLGVIFNNAIALEPSNHAYRPQQGTMILMSAPQNGWIEVNFTQPVRFFSCYVTSQGRTTLSAYDTQNQIITSVETLGANLAHHETTISPNTFLSVTVANISRITLDCLEGLLTISELSLIV